MKRLLPLLASVLCVSVALAEPPAAAPAKTAASELVNAQVLVPLQRSEAKRSRFSRAAPVPVQRRVRVIDPTALTDSRGKDFVRFAIDERRAFGERGTWHEDSVVGCAYVNEQQVFVRRGAAYLPARSLLGKDDKEQPGVCLPAPAGAGQLAQVPAKR